MKIFKILAAISVLIIIIGAGIYIYYQYTLYLEYLERTIYLENRIAEEIERNKILTTLYIERFSDERVEQMARDRLGLVLTNEILFVPISEN